METKLDFVDLSYLNAEAERDARDSGETKQEETISSRRDRGLKKDDEYGQKVRPSTWKKWVKNYNGTSDPYDHIAAFRQVLYAKKVKVNHTTIEEIGMTLEGRALA